VHGFQTVNSSGGFLTGPLDLVQDIPSFPVDHEDHVCSVIDYDLRIMIQNHVDGLVIFFVGLLSPTVHVKP
jgi:hypothetical protein